jgi:dipeptidyl aminopeptidase/acylaminoacyl peptidase
MSTRWPDAPRTALVAAGMSGAYRHLEHRILAMTRVKPYSTRQLAVSAAVASLIVLGGLIPWRLVAQEPARPRLPAAPSAPLVAPNVPTTQLQNGSSTTYSVSGSSSFDGTSGSSSSSSTSSSSSSTSVVLPGKIYARAGLQLKTKTGATEKVVGIIAIDPNTGAWERLGLDGFSIRVSPQQDRLAFCKFASPGLIDVYLADLKGHGAAKALDNASLSTWSPDGKRLLSTRTKNQANDRPERVTLTLDLLNKQVANLPIPATDEVDDWSRDGEWFVTVSNRHPPFGSGYQLYVMHPDGTHERRITQGHGLNCYPRFRPGTNQIVYNHQDHGFDSLWLVDLDGTNRKKLLSSDKDGVGAPDGAYWSPDGQWLAVPRFDWQTDVPGIANPNHERFRAPGACKDRLEIIAADGTSRGVLTLQGVTHVDWIENGDWR